MATQDKSRRFYVGLHQTELKDERYWIERQVYLALGTCSSAPVVCRSMPAPWKASTHLLDAELGLAERGLTSVVLVALGYRSEDDFNAKLPKSRLPETEIFTSSDSHSRRPMPAGVGLATTQLPGTRAKPLALSVFQTETP
jgi:nitroreductase/dihydropteridine reductase